jgi:hypothetical protein
MSFDLSKAKDHLFDMETPQTWREDQGRMILESYGHMKDAIARIEQLEVALIDKQTQLMPVAPSCYNSARKDAAILRLKSEGLL